MRNLRTLSQHRTASWFSIPKPNPLAKLRLFCFPYAGSGANIFYKWPRSLPDRVELVLVHLPGREHRLKEKPFDRMAPLVTALGRALLPYTDKALAFFGHSMGGLISFELSRHLRREYGIRASQLFISGCVGPQSAHLLPRIHDLPEAQLIRELRQFASSTRLMAGNAEFLKLMLPTIRADCAVCETYGYASEPPLDCALTVYGGIADDRVRCQHLEAWRSETTGPFAIHLFRGSHFFLHSDEALMLEVLSKELDNLTTVLSQAQP